MSDVHWWRPDGDGVVLAVRVTPRAARDAVEGVHVDAAGRPRLAIRVRAAPDRGAANRAACALLARHFDVAASSVEVVAGGSSRVKSVRVAGLDPRLLTG